MSLVGTLAKVALGVAAIKGAKGVGNMMSQRAAASGGSVGNGGLGGPGAARANTAGAQPGLGDPLTPSSAARARRAAGLAACSNSSLPPVQVLGPLPARQHRRRAAVSTR